MKNYVLLLLSLSLASLAHSQSAGQRIDDSLKLVDKRTKFYKRKVPKQDGMTVFFFKKKNNELFSIIDIKAYRNSRGGADSSVSMGYIYNNQILVKANCNRRLYNQKDKNLRWGLTSFYFNNNVLIAKTAEKNFPDADVEFMIKQANDLLLRARYVQ